MTDSNTIHTIPLCVDLDGSLIHTDLVIESLLILASQRPLTLLLLPFWLLRGKAYFKQKIAEVVRPSVENLPYHHHLLEYLKQEKATGREIYLATGAHYENAQAIAHHLKLFDGIIASDSTTNMTGKNKARALSNRFGKNGFDYIGNSNADIPVWKAANKAILVSAPARLVSFCQQHFDIALIIPGHRGGLRTILKACRPHQWAKNFLLFIPLLMSHQFMLPELAISATLGFVLFCLCSSAVYLVNDMLDIESDRQHPKKRFRPFAAATLSPATGILTTLLLLALAGAGTSQLSLNFTLTLLCYLIISLSYSALFKRKLALDAIILASLYTLRIVAGGAAIGAFPSFWLLAFSMFIFLSLAVSKRYSELHRLENEGRSKSSGRQYQTDDMAVLVALGTGSGLLSVLVLALYINSESIQILYSTPQVIWLLCPILMYWILRLWLLAGRGEVNEDPLLFALTDRTSYITGLGAMVILWAAL